MITSRSNPKIQQLRALLTKKGRTEQRAFLLEGPRVIGEALDSGLSLTLAVHDETASSALLARLAQAGVPTIEAAPQVVAALCGTKTPQGITACAPLPDSAPPAQYEGLWAVLDAVQDPGNVGTILRTADALGAIGVLLGAGCADAYSPKALRAAMGSLFHIRVASGELGAELVRMKAQGYFVLAGHPRGQNTLPPLPPNTAVLIGNEGNGLSEEAQALADCLYRIEMKGRAESLNAGAASAILLYEVSKHI